MSMSAVSGLISLVLEGGQSRDVYFGMAVRRRLINRVPSSGDFEERRDLMKDDTDPGGQGSQLSDGKGQSENTATKPRISPF